jgi:hypothetical protein
MTLSRRGFRSEGQTHGLIAGLAGLRASATLQPEAQRTSTGGPKLIATDGPRSVAKLTNFLREALPMVASYESGYESGNYYLVNGVSHGGIRLNPVAGIPPSAAPAVHLNT